MTIEPQPAGPTFARSASVNGTCTTYGRILCIYIYKKHIYNDEDFSPLYDKCGARAARQQLLVTELASLAIMITTLLASLGIPEKRRQQRICRDHRNEPWSWVRTGGPVCVLFIWTKGLC